MWRDEYSCEKPERQLSAYRMKNGTEEQLVPLTPDEIDFEMENSPHSKQVLELRRITQEGLEHFVRQYGSTYRGLQLTWASGVKDLSPLGNLPNLEFLVISGCRCDKLWDMSKNEHLRILIVDNCTKLTENPSLLESAPALEIIWYLVGSFATYSMSSMRGFSHLPSVKEIRLQDIRLKDHNLDFLSTIPTLENFDFPANLFTTNEIAWMKAKYPELNGEFLRAYGPAHHGSTSYVRVSGTRKPELFLPDDQAKLDKYIQSFNNLVMQYRQE